MEHDHRARGAAVRRDVTARTRTTHRPRASEERFWLAFDSAPIGMALVASDYRFLRVNQTLCRMLGYTETELLAHGFPAITHPDDLAKDVALAERLFGGEVPSYSLEKRYIAKAGEVVPVRLTATALPDAAGRTRSGIAMIEDIHAQRDRALRETERRDHELLPEVLAGISHDLRAPVAAIKASISVVLANEPPGTPEPLHRLLTNIEHSADRLDQLIGDLIDLERLRMGRLTLLLEEVDLRLVVRRVVQEVKPIANERGQHLHLRLPAAGVRVTADATQMERVLFNLLHNAVKYGRPGGHIGVRVSNPADPAPHPDEVQIEVHDDGPGISAGDQARIFERFYRAGAHRQEHAGLGLGLTIARSIVELHGGTIWVDSRPGTGATFTIALPRSHSALPYAHSAAT